MPNITLNKNEILSGYPDLLKKLKEQIRRAQTKAAISINEEMIRLYWNIGRQIIERQEAEGWGSQVTKKLSKDLIKEFPKMKGFSDANLRRMKAFYETYAICAQAVRKLEDAEIQVFYRIPWGHNIALIQKLDCNEERLWYAKKTTDHGWSRAILIMQIESKLFQRQGNATTNFHKTLAFPQSDLVHQTLKDPYTFDFLTIGDDALERELEQGLVDHIQQFLVELGTGFAFIGRQFPIHVEDTDYFLDLLFYHYKLRCFCVIELKTSEFKPEYAGKMNFYLAAVDEQLKHKDDKPTIGMILCKGKKKITVEYALRMSQAPIGVSSYETQLLENLPENLKGSLPSIKELEEEFEK